MNNVIVLVTSGKDEEVFEAYLRVFQDKETAFTFCKATNTGPIKYWAYAEIVEDGQKVDLINPYAGGY